MRFITVCSLFLLSVAANASTITVDFEEFAPQGSASPEVTPYVSQGYRVSSDLALVWPDGYGGIPTQYLAYSPAHSVDIQAVNGSAFSLYSTDMALPGLVGSGTLPWTVTGYYKNGGSISTDIAVTGAMATYQFGVDWSNLDSVVFSGVNGAPYVSALDNIVLSSVVPIPAAVWLFGSALAGLGWMRRKQTV
jgi:hypothetical protein